MVNGSCKKDLWTASVSADSQGLNEGADRRAFERYPANLQARLFYGNTIYSGMITNLSKSGMFVSTRVKFPVNSEFVMVVNLNNRSMKIPVKVRRSTSMLHGVRRRLQIISPCFLLIRFHFINLPSRHFHFYHYHCVMISISGHAGITATGAFAQQVLVLKKYMS
jgi:hypothetical protein